jgi:hypothetical protein
MRPEFPLGSLGRFVHPDFGLIRGRYVKAGRIDPEIMMGSPFGWERDSTPWTVTNRMAFADTPQGAIAGLGACFATPATDSYFWLVEEGYNIQGVAAYVEDGPHESQPLVWAETGAAGLGVEYLGVEFGYLLKGSVATPVIGIPGLNAFPAGSVRLQLGCCSQAVLDDAIDTALVNIQANLANLQNQIDAISALLPGALSRLDSQDLQLTSLSTELTTLGALTTQSITAQGNRLTAAEAGLTLLREESPEAMLEQKILNLESRVETVEGLASQTTMNFENAIATTSIRVGDLAGEMAGVSRELHTLHAGKATQGDLDEFIVNANAALGDLDTRVTALEP